MESAGVLERVADTIARYRMFQRGHRVGVAVSGGADSVCLLEALLRLAPRWDLSLAVLHFDHRLRGAASEQDARFVAELARRRGLPFHSGSADVAELARRARDNLEQAGRRARREFFMGFLRTGQLDRVALGHTRSDQAETVLFRLLRGSGPTGLAGIRPVTPEGFVRPLIAISREEIEGFLRQEGWEWRLDHTNLDLRLARNRIRYELLGLFRRQWNPAIEKILAQTALLAQEDEEYWEQETGRLAQALFEERGSAWVVKASALASLPRAAARRLIRRAVAGVAGSLRGWEFGHIEGILRLAEVGGGSGCVTGPGLLVRRSLDWLCFAPWPAAEERGYRLRVEAPGEYRPAGTGMVIRLRLSEGRGAGDGAGGADWLDWRRLAWPLELRSWQPGDRYRPAGHGQEVKLKELLQRARIPLWERKKWPIMTSGREIVWTLRFGPAAAYAAAADCPVVLAVEAVAEEAADDGVTERGGNV